MSNPTRNVNHNPNRAWSQFLRAVRTDMGFTQEQFAESLGIDKNRIAKWETGQIISSVKLRALMENAIGPFPDEVIADIGRGKYGKPFVPRHAVQLVSTQQDVGTSESERTSPVDTEAVSLASDLNRLLGEAKQEIGEEGDLVPDAVKEQIAELEQKLEQKDAIIRRLAAALEVKLSNAS